MAPQARHRLGLAARGIAEDHETLVLRQFQRAVDGEGGRLAAIERTEHGQPVRVRQFGHNDQDSPLPQTVEVGGEGSVRRPDDGLCAREGSAGALPGQRAQRLCRMVGDETRADLGSSRKRLHGPSDAPAARNGDSAPSQGLPQGVQPKRTRTGRQRALGNESAQRLEGARRHAALPALSGACERRGRVPPEGRAQRIERRQVGRDVFWQVECGEKRRLSRQDVLQVVACDDVDPREDVGWPMPGKWGGVEAEPQMCTFHKQGIWRPMGENLSGGAAMRLRDVGEVRFIEGLRQFAGPDALGLLDDCALLQPMGPKMLVSTDAMVAGVHFDPAFMSWRDIGFRALAGALSDLAASGAYGPSRYTVAAWLPADFSLQDARELYLGMRECASSCGAELAGGDTVFAPTLFVSLTVFAAASRPVTRSGASPGDVVYCSGTLGLAARGLELARQGGTGRAVDRFLRPLPRLELGRALSLVGATACADVSDGLYPELKAIAEASSVGIEVDEGALPVVDDVPRSTALRYAYGGGEDYELVFTGPGDLLERIARMGGDMPRCTAIGRVQSRARGLSVRRGGTVEPLAASGYDHFGGGGA